MVVIGEARDPDVDFADRQGRAVRSEGVMPASS